MRKLLRASALLAGGALLCGHVGSSLAVFEGAFGPYRLRVVVRPPAVVPGLADVSVRVLEGPRPERVTVQPLLLHRGIAGHPRPDAAVPAPGEEGLFASSLWFMARGSYNVRVTAEGPAGKGVADVPVVSLPTRPPEMSPPLAALLILSGLLLVAGIAAMAGAAVREGRLPPGESPDGAARRRGRLAAAGTAAAAALLLYFGRAWWARVDAETRGRLFRPVPLSASAENGVLRLSVEAWRGGGTPPLVPDHGKMMHLFLVRDPERDALAHLHPTGRGAKFAAALPPIPAGDYLCFADVTHEDGLSHTLTGRVRIPPPPANPPPEGPPPDPDDSWHAGPPAPGGPGAASVCLLQGGLTMAFRPVPLAPGRETVLAFEVRDGAGRAVPLDPYMGMMGHAAILKDDGTVFLHVHPVGTISMAAQEIHLGRRPALPPPGEGGHEGHDHPQGPPPSAVRFPCALPEAGSYRIFVQVKRQGKVLTGVFDAEVEGK